MSRVYLREVRYKLVGIKIQNPLANSRRKLEYEFSQPPEYYIETCTSFYVCSGLRWLTRWVGYWTPTKPHHYSSAYHRLTPPPWHHYLRHTIGNERTSWLGTIHPVRREPVPFLNAAKLLILSCLRTATIDPRMGNDTQINMKRLLELIYMGVRQGVMFSLSPMAASSSPPSSVIFVYACLTSLFFCFFPRQP